MRFYRISLAFLLCLLIAIWVYLYASRPQLEGPLRESGTKPAPAEPQAEAVESEEEEVVLKVVGTAEDSGIRLSYNQRQGRELFLYYCSPCHGVAGQGDGFNAYNLDPRPRDLSDLVFQDARSDEDLKDVIASGGRAFGLTSGMPPWGRTLHSRQIENLVLFLRSIRAAKIE